MSIRLSICIPTYNRERFIGTTLDSVLSQATTEVEVVVCDNASTDNTQEMVERLFAGRSNVRYFRWDRNMGADRNFLKVVELASGDYCWFMGSDDIVEPGAVEHILGALSLTPPIAGGSVNLHGYTTDLSTRIWTRPIADGALHSDHLFTDAEEGFSVLGAYFGYLPGQIVNRQLWNGIVARHDLDPYLNAYVHVYVIGRMLQENARWLYIHRPCVGWRSGNDSFMSEGRYRRLAIDVIGYEKIGGDVFGRRSKPYRSLMTTAATVHVKSALLGAKAQAAKADFYLRSLRLCVLTYWRYPQFWLQTFPVFLLPRFGYVAIRLLYRLTMKPSRVRRANAG